MQSYENSEIYQLAHKRGVKIHNLTLQKLPKFETYEEGQHIRKSSKSISSNIPEGFRYRQDCMRFLTCDHPSCEKTIEHVECLYETNSLRDVESLQ